MAKRQPHVRIIPEIPVATCKTACHLACYAWLCNRHASATHAARRVHHAPRRLRCPSEHCVVNKFLSNFRGGAGMRTWYAQTVSEVWSTCRSCAMRWRLALMITSAAGPRTRGCCCGSTSVAAAKRRLQPICVHTYVHAWYIMFAP